MNTTKQIQFLKEILTEEEFTDLKKEPEAFQEATTLYESSYIDTVIVMPFHTKRFVLKKKEISNLLPNWKGTLRQIALQENLVNPVYVQVENDGTMNIY